VCCTTCGKDEDHLPLLASECDCSGSGVMGRPKKVERPGMYARSRDTSHHHHHHHVPEGLGVFPVP
jgi:hypothetical protein